MGRINAISGTATTVANDDYIAIDGATNGSRKKLASSLVTLADAQTLTNKTLTAPVIGEATGTSLALSAPTNGIVIGAGTPSLSNAITVANLYSGTTVSLPNITDESIVTMSQNGAGYASFAAKARMAGGSTFSHYAGFETIGGAAAGTTITDHYQFFALPLNDGTITNLHGLLVADSAEAGGTGTVENQYGLFVRSLTSGTESNIAIKTEGSAGIDLGGVLTTRSGIVNRSGYVALSLIAAANGTEGGSNFLDWYRADGTTRKGSVGYLSDNSTIMYLATTQAGGIVRISSGNAGTAATFDANQHTTLAGNLTVVGSNTILALPASAPSLTSNSTMTFELTSNTSISIKVRGSDGTTRTGTISLS